MAQLDAYAFLSHSTVLYLSLRGAQGPPAVRIVFISTVDDMELTKIYIPLTVHNIMILGK